MSRIELADVRPGQRFYWRGALYEATGELTGKALPVSDLGAGYGTLIRPGGEPLERAPGQEFAFGAWIYDVDRGQAIVKAFPRPTVQVCPRELETMFTLGVVRVDQGYAADVDLSRPILLAALPKEGAGHIVVDGWHRVYRALTERVEQLPAYRLDFSESTLIRRRLPSKTRR